MKKALMAALLALVSVGALHAQDLGATPQGLIAKYGKPARVEAAWCGGTAYGFNVGNGSYVYAIIDGYGRVGDVSYFNFHTPLTREVANRLLSTQYPMLPVSDWYDQQSKKTLGVESGKNHWVLTQWVYLSAGDTYIKEGLSFISNEKDGGWQFRTRSQFDYEQKVIKQQYRQKGV